MSDSSRPESATASLTAVSACEASGISAERVAFEKPTPLTATLHRFSHIPAILLQSAFSRATPPPNPPHQRGREGEMEPFRPLPLDGGGLGGGDAAPTPARR